MHPPTTIRGVVRTFHSDVDRNRLIIDLMTGDGPLEAVATDRLAQTITRQLRAARTRRELAIARCTGISETNGVLLLMSLSLEGA